MSDYIPEESTFFCLPLILFLPDVSCVVLIRTPRVFVLRANKNFSLKRLSIEDAVRCTSVCKSWYSLITSPIFISLHSQHLASINKSLLLVRDCLEKPNKERYSLWFDDDDQFEECKKIILPVERQLYDSIFRVVGCVNGVVCLSDDERTFTDVIVLWNPSIRKYVRLPQPLFSYTSHGDSVYSVGFGFDAVENNLKVVRVAYLESDISSGKILPRVEVFEPSIGSWRIVDAKGFPFVIDGSSSQAFLHGNVHWVLGNTNRFEDFNSQGWLMRTKNQFKNLNTRWSIGLIVTFDLTSEVFEVIDVPDIILEYNSAPHFLVSMLGESLSLIHHTLSLHDRSCCIWVMKQYGEPDSWTKLFTVDVTGDNWHVVGFWRNGEALLKTVSTYRNYSSCEFVSFDPKSRLANCLGADGDWISVYVGSFVESLALIGVEGETN